MENNIQHIELINQYLNKELSFNESEIFMDRLKTDSYFKNLYENHVIFLEGLKRQTLKTEIKTARQQYIKSKWMKFGIVSMVIITALIAAYFLLINKNDVEAEPNETHNSEIILDSISTKKEVEQVIMVGDTQPTEKEEVKNVVDTLRVKPEVKLISKEVFTKIPESFKVNTLKDTTIICKEGAKLIIKANSFVDVANKPVQGNIDFQVTEYYKLSDMLLANLSTTSNSNQLETGGMLYIEAKKGNEILKLKENMGIEIHFPTRVKKENMQLFSGTWKDSVMDWALQPNRIEISKDPIIGIIGGERVEVPFAVVEEPPIFPGCENLSRTESKKCTSEAILKHVQGNFNTSIAEKLGLKGRLRVTALFKINENGDVVDIQSGGVHPEIEEEANRVVGLLPRMLPGKQRGKLVKVPYSLPITFQMKGDSGNPSTLTLRQGVIASDSLANIDFENSLEDETNLKASRVNSYILRTLDLGWINCDRFINGKTQRIKYSLKVNDGNGAVVSLIFKSMNSVLPSRKINGFYDFGTVGKDEEVVIVAIKQKEAKLYLGIIDSKTEANPDLEFNFKEVTIQEMKNELQKLNTLFE